MMSDQRFLEERLHGQPCSRRSALLGIAGAAATAAVFSHATPAGAAPAEDYHNVKDYGAVGDGVTNDREEFQELFDTMAPGSTVFVPPGIYVVGGLTVRKPFRLEAMAGAVLRKDRAMFLIEPDSLPSGQTGAAAAPEDRVVSVLGAGWADNEWQGAWVELKDGRGSATDDDVDDGDDTVRPKAPTPVRRRVLASTSDSLLLDFPCGRRIAEGAAVTFRWPLPFVEIVGIRIEETQVEPRGAANLAIKWADRVRLYDVTSLNANHSSIRVMQCRNVRIGGAECSGKRIPIFAYHSDDVVIHDSVVHSSTYGSHGIQLKDVRNGHVVSCTVRDGVNKRAIDVKGSGLNPAHDCSVVDSVVRDWDGIAFSAYVQDNEGDHFGLENVSIQGCKAIRCKKAIQVWEQTVAGGRLRNCVVSDLFAVDARQIGLDMRANNAVVERATVSGCGGRAGQAGGIAETAATSANSREVPAWAAGMILRDVRLHNNNVGVRRIDNCSTRTGSTRLRGGFPGAFRPDDVGKRIIVEDAGTLLDGQSEIYALMATIIGVEPSSEAVLDRPAEQTTRDATAWIPGERHIVPGCSINEGETRLRFPRSGLASTDQRRRVRVPGAGPGGDDLFSSLRLASSGPGRVEFHLEDEASTSVRNVTIELGGKRDAAFQLGRGTVGMSILNCDLHISDPLSGANRFFDEVCPGNDPPCPDRNIGFNNRITDEIGVLTGDYRLLGPTSKFVEIQGVKVMPGADPGNTVGVQLAEE